VVPRAFGRFSLPDSSEAVLTDRVCKKCNSDLGKLDAEICYNGPEAFLRGVTGVKGRRPEQVKPSPFHPGARTRKPLVMKGRRPGDEHDTFWEFSPKDGMQELRSIQFRHPVTQETIAVHLEPTMDKFALNETG